MTTLEAVAADVATIKALLLAQVARPEWEPQSQAVRSRRRSRETLVDAVARGLVRERRDPPGRGGFQARYLKTEDLDRHFPVVAK